MILKVLVAQSCLTLCHSMDCSPPCSSVHGILQVRILEWVAIPFSGDLPDPRIKLMSLALHTDSVPSEPPGKPPRWFWCTQWLCFSDSLGDHGSIPGLGSSSGEGNGIHSCILAWRIPWTEKPWMLIKNLPAMWETPVRSLGWEDP